MHKILILLVALSLTFQLSACSDAQTGPSLKTLRIGLLPDEGEAALRKRYTPLFDYLSQATGLTYELIIPNSYQDLLERFGKGQIDLAYFGGVTFVKAHSEFGAVPLAMRDIDSRFTSSMIVAGEGLQSVAELRGKRLSFGSQLSTSGHLMPRHFLQAQYELEPETHFGSVQYSGQHDRTAYWVRDGKVDVGIANSEIIQQMLADGRLRSGDIRIIWTTPPFPDYVWAVQPLLQRAEREKIQQAFLQLSAENPQHQIILSQLGSAGFYPASIDDFSVLQQIMTRRGVL